MNPIDNQLLVSAYEGDITTALHSIFSGANVEVTVQDTDVTPLILASAKGNGSIVLALLANDADRFKIDNEGKTAEDYAYKNGHYDVFEILNSWVGNKHEPYRDSQCHDYVPQT